MSKTTEVQARLRTAQKLHQNGQIAAAVEEYRHLVATSPKHPILNYLLGVGLLQLQRPIEALSPLKLTTRLKPDNTASWCALGRAHAACGNVSDARTAFQKALRIDPGAILAVRGLGNLLANAREWEELLQLIERAPARVAEELTIVALYLRALVGVGRHPDALTWYASFREGHPSADIDYTWLKEILVASGGASENPLLLLRASTSPKTLFGCATACLAVGQTKDALHFLKALRRRDPEGTLVSLVETGDALLGCSALEDAEAAYWAALQKDPLNNQALNHLGHALRQLSSKGRPEKFMEAKELLEAGLRRNPDDVENLSLLANIWMQASCPAQALPEFERAFSLKSPSATRYSSYLFNLNYAEDRTPDQVFAAHREWSALFEPHALRPAPAPIQPVPDRRLRIGYVSPDFTFHPVAYFFKPIAEAHDRTEVEVFLYSNRKLDGGTDAMAKDLREIADHWRDVFEMSDLELEEQIQADQIDILIDLAGHSGENRLTLFARRPAPVQVSWLGYPNTTGLKSIDYRFSDTIVEPPGEADAISSETIVRLPNGFHVYQMRDAFPETNILPALENGHITFGCFNNLNKVGPRTIRLWAQLLKAVPAAILFIKHDSLKVLANRERLLSMFALFGVSPARLKLTANKKSNNNHLLCYHEVDVSLDPLAYNGTTTTCESLLMGVPVLTLPGNRHASRVSASLLHRVGLDDWIAADEEDFVRIGAAAALATEKLNALRKSLRQRFLNSPLNDARGLACDLERAYRQMWIRRCQVATTEASKAIPVASS